MQIEKMILEWSNRSLKCVLTRCQEENITSDWEAVLGTRWEVSSCPVSRWGSAQLPAAEAGCSPPLLLSPLQVCSADWRWHRDPWELLVTSSRWWSSHCQQGDDRVLGLALSGIKSSWIYLIHLGFTIKAALFAGCCLAWWASGRLPKLGFNPLCLLAGASRP